MEVEDLPDLKEVKALHKALKKADVTWIATFRDSRGIDGIYKVMFTSDGIEGLSFHCSGPSALRLERQHCTAVS